MRRLLLFICLFFVAQGLSAAPFTIDKIVATVGSNVILLSEVNFEARVALITHGQELGLMTQIDDGLRKSALQEVIIQTLLFEETKRLRAFDSVEKEEAALKALRSILQSELGDPLQQAINEFGLTDDELNNYLRRRLYSERLLNERVSGPLSEEEITNFYRENSALFGDKPLREVREQVIAAAQKIIVQERLIRFLEDLKNRFTVRVFFSSK